MIFCVEDDDSSRELTVYALNAAGFEAEGFADARSFWARLRELRPELVILDIMLPDEDGITVLKKLRDGAGTADIPVVMATAKGAEYDKVVGLDMGADDYLTKPFGMLEMVSRVRAVLRRSGNGKNTALLRVGDIVMNQAEHSVRVRGDAVALTLKEYELLRLLMSNPGKVFTRDVLLSSVWSSDYEGETRTVDVHIGTLRTKLSDQGDRIRTVRGVGYRLEEGL